MQVDILFKNYQVENKHMCSKEVSKKLDQCINKIIEKSGFIKCNIEKKPVCTSGGNYLGILYEIDIKGKTMKGDKELNLFVKTVMPDEGNIKIISICDVYKTEVFAYKELSKMFEELQDVAQVPLDERFKMVKSYDESNTEMIIMENLSKKGFNTGHRMDVVSPKFAEMAIQELAKFHAFAFVLKVKHPEFFEKQIKIRKTPYVFGEQWHGFVESMIKIPMNFINEDVRERVKKFSEGIAGRFGRHYDDETIKRCLCHGDYRPNNILTKMIDGEVSEVIPVDYQLMYYGCPIIDILYFIIYCTDQKFRRVHLTHLKDLYHETLTKFLKYFDIDVNSVYPRQEFEMEYRKKLDHGLMFALILLAFGFASDDDVPDLTNNESLNFKVGDKYKDRIQGIVEDYIDWGVI